MIIELVGIVEGGQVDSVDTQYPPPQFRRRFTISDPGEFHEQGTLVRADGLHPEWTTGVPVEEHTGGKALAGKIGVHLHHDLPSEAVWSADPADHTLGVRTAGIHSAITFSDRCRRRRREG